MASLSARLRKMTAKLRPRKKTAEVRVVSVARCPGKSRFEQEQRKALADDLLQQAPIVSMQEAWFDEPPVPRDSQTVSQRDSDDKRSSSDYSSSDYSSSHSSESRYSSSDYSSSSSDSGGSCSSD